MASPVDFHGLLKIKFKVREDSISDQYNRIFMMKMMLIFATLTGINWFKDEVSCIIPATADIDRGFVNSACWIQGLYVYKGVNGTGRTAYHGIPTDLFNDGIIPGPDRLLCNTNPRDRVVKKNCRALTKTFYLQYQWFPFYLALLAVMFYLPYVIFKLVNTDITSLKKAAVNGSAASLVKSYFNYRINDKPRMKIRVLLNLLVKVLYVFANIAAFLITDTLINGDFRAHGQNWSGWVSSKNEVAYQYSMNRVDPKPGEFLLPVFGLCQVVEAAVDALVVKRNVHTFVCEISMHVLYQYVLIALWVLLVIGIVISVLGFVLRLVDFIMGIVFHTAMSVLFLKQGSGASKVYRRMGAREIDYLELVRRNNLTLYKEVLELLLYDRPERQSSSIPLQGISSAENPLAQK